MLADNVVSRLETNLPYLLDHIVAARIRTPTPKRLLDGQPIDLEYIHAANAGSNFIAQPETLVDLEAQSVLVVLPNLK